LREERGKREERSIILRRKKIKIKIKIKINTRPQQNPPLPHCISPT
jgi:hypothetical protein